MNPTITFSRDEALRQFTTHLEAGLKSRETVANYSAAITQARDFLGGIGFSLDVGHAGREHLELFFADLGQRVSPATVLNRAQGLNAFFKWLLAEREIARNPLEHVACPDYGIPVPWVSFRWQR